jgi:5'-deoxynucleotidase YfbR-like HD superfamily hydrolase
MISSERSGNYRPPISQDLRKKYESLLSQTMRWENGLLDSNTPESDLEHVAGMLEVLEEMKQRFVHIPNEVNFTTVAHMIYLHDAGEILAGDLNHSHPEYHDLKPKVKKRERAAFRLLSRSIEDKPTRDLARQLYERINRKDSDDKEAHLADFIDKDQAVRFGLNNIFPAEALENENKRSIQLNYTIALLLNPGEAFVRSLTSDHSKNEAIKFIKEEIENFKHKGYKELEVNPYIQRIFLLSPTGVIR